jgi:hypothetical protein
MSKAPTMTQRLDTFARAHPRLLWLANAILTMFVALVLLTGTEAPLVLYQAF